MDKKKKPALSPEAAKILEQYRNSGKTPAGESGPGGLDGGDAAPKPSTGPPAPNAMRRSGTRGK